MQKWLCPALDAGFFILGSTKLPKMVLTGKPRVSGLCLNPRLTTTRLISPARQAPETLGHSDGIGRKRSLTTERLASPRR